MEGKFRGTRRASGTVRGEEEMSREEGSETL